MMARKIPPKMRKHWEYGVDTPKSYARKCGVSVATVYKRLEIIARLLSDQLKQTITREDLLERKHRAHHMTKTPGPKPGTLIFRGPNGEPLIEGLDQAAEAKRIAKAKEPPLPKGIDEAYKALKRAEKEFEQRLKSITAYLSNRGDHQEEFISYYKIISQYMSEVEKWNNMFFELQYAEYEIYYAIKQNKDILPWIQQAYDKGIEFEEKTKQMEKYEGQFSQILQGTKGYSIALRKAIIRYCRESVNMDKTQKALDILDEIKEANRRKN